MTPPSPPRPQPQPQPQPHPQRSADQTRPTSPARAQPPSYSYAQQQAAPPPPPSGGPPVAPPPDEETSGFPTWIWIIIGALAGILLLVVAFVGYTLLSNAEEATPTPTPTETVVEETAPTDPPATETNTPTPPPTLTATPPSTQSTPTPQPEAGGPPEGGGGEERRYAAELAFDPPPPQVNLNVPFTLTATLRNTGDVDFEVLNYDPLGTWEHYLTWEQKPERVSLPLPPQESRRVTFIFRPHQTGEAEIKLTAQLLINQIPPAREIVEAEPIRITIVP
ncbi:MAG: hypothetical protein ACP5HM_03315 [Anaerolineae bacterium]